MKTKIIQIGDVFSTKMKHLTSFEMVDVIQDWDLSIDDIQSTLNRKNIHKVEIFKTIVVTTKEESLVDDYMKECPILVKYNGQGKFEELKTGKILLCSGSDAIPGFTFVDGELINYVHGNVYHSFHQLNEISSFIKENPIGLGTNINTEEEVLIPIKELDAISYKTFTNYARNFAFEKIETKAKKYFMESIQRQVNYDYDFASLENRINSFVKIWKTNKQYTKK